MSLTRMIQLLSMGRSLQGSRQRGGLYNIDAGAIPRFEGSGQMPLRLPRAAESAPAFRAAEKHGAKAAPRRPSLDDVKVVRNDLSETDLDVVVRARHALTGREATFERREVAGWKRLTARLFRPGAMPAPHPRELAARP